MYYLKSPVLNDEQKSQIIKIGGECDVKIHIVDYNIIVLEYFILKLKKIMISQN